MQTFISSPQELIVETTIEDLKCHLMEYFTPNFLALVIAVKPTNKFVCVCLDTYPGMTVSDPLYVCVLVQIPN